MSTEGSLQICRIQEWGSLGAGLEEKSWAFDWSIAMLVTAEAWGFPYCGRGGLGKSSKGAGTDVPTS